MKAVPTQFGDRNFSGAVATPTCSSCCCCCCCVATTVAGSIVLARSVRSEAKANSLPSSQVNRLTVAAALAFPAAIVLLILFAVFESMVGLPQLPGGVIGLLVIAGAALICMIAIILSKISGKQEVIRGICWLVSFVVLFVVELFVGGALLLGIDGGAGSVGAYFLLVLVVIVLASVPFRIAGRKSQ